MHSAAKPSSALRSGRVEKTVRQVSALVKAPLHALRTFGWIAEPAVYGSAPPLTKPQKRTRLTPLEARTCKPVRYSSTVLAPGSVRHAG